ncbi:MAG: hypothetical protein ACYDD0_00830 [Candidatus Dormibacteria bacterium]
MSWEMERDPSGQVVRIKIHTEDWLCPACGQRFPADSGHDHNRIICARGVIPEIPPGRKSVPETDAWLAEHT